MRDFGLTAGFFSNICLTVFTAINKSTLESKISLETFLSVMQQLKSYKYPQDINAFVSLIPVALINKLRTIKSVTLQKYYRVKLKRGLSLAIDSCYKISDIVDSFLNLTHRPDLLSNYACHLSIPKERKYVVFTI